MKEKLNNLKNSTGVLSILMVITLFLPWYKSWYQSSSVPTLTAFEVATVNKTTFIIILLVFIILIACVAVADVKVKNKITGGLSIIILLFNIIARIQLVKLPSESSNMTFKGINLGWIIITLLSLVQIIISVNQLKNEVK